MRLSQREKQMVISGIALLVLFVLFQAVVKPAVGRLETLGRVVPDKQETLTQLHSKSEEYLALQQEIGHLRDRISSQRNDFAILSFLEDIEKECGLVKNVVGLKPATTTYANNLYVERSVEIKLENVSLQQITQFLLRIESDKASVGVKALHMRTAVKNSALLDATIQFTTLTLVVRPRGSRRAGEG